VTFPNVDDREHTVYWAYGTRRRLLYIGCTADPVRRMKDHRRSSEWFPLVRRVELETFSTRAPARVTETLAIYDERPRFNRRLDRPTLMRWLPRPLRAELEIEAS
jgi:hypothetical protein